MDERPVELKAIEARIWSLLEPHRAELEDATIYGMPSLRWPGAKAHDYFASVRSGKGYVSLYLLVADTYPDALEGTPAPLLKRRSGKAAFTFPGGALAVGIAGALIVVAGLGNFLEAWTATFRRVLDAKAPDWTVYAGRAGYAARGAVFVMIGWQVIALASGIDDGRLGMESAMAELSRREWLFTVVASGLGLFGLFSLVMAAYARIREENVIERLKAEMVKHTAR